ncbi:PaaI family thioesterase [Croceicoccus bisphenolivorans]|uniref:PaaI family thioesterase n=1 Tax=Croceicoccus bisphenolivorans TaxID=1783232 RepID=UPI0008316916|nr:PaaI family thioesterase [Croceicoccus bisphenolivorans]
MVDSLYPAPDHPGWQEWRVSDSARFNHLVLGRMLVRLDDPHTARIRIEADDRHTNVNGVMHGGAILSLIDSAMFAGSTVITAKDQMRAVTVDLQVQFLSPGILGRSIDALVEVTRETGRMLFMRGLVVQDEERVASFTGLFRKLS